MELIANHFTDSSFQIRGFALEFYVILADIFIDFDSSNSESLAQYLERPQEFLKKSKKYNKI